MPTGRRHRLGVAYLGIGRVWTFEDMLALPKRCVGIVCPLCREVVERPCTIRVGRHCILGAIFFACFQEVVGVLGVQYGLQRRLCPRDALERGEVPPPPPPPSGRTAFAGYCLPDSKCQLQWHL